MKKINKKANIVKIILLIIFLLYFVFLWLDIFKVKIFISSDNLKFLSMILVLILSLMIGKDALFSRDKLLLQLGILITITADVFLLLLNNNYSFGIGLFCLVQIIYSIRYKVGKSKEIIGVFSLIFMVLFLTYIVLEEFIMKIDFLIIIALYYSICLLSSTSKGILTYKNASYPSLNSKLIAVGMILFLLCDINVGLYNILSAISRPNAFMSLLKRISFVSMWLFYLPSQVLLALSGYRDEYLKKIFKEISMKK